MIYHGKHYSPERNELKYPSYGCYACKLLACQLPTTALSHRSSETGPDIFDQIYNQPITWNRCENVNMW